MTIHEFRKAVKARWPHVKISVRTVSFSDLLRRDAKCLTVDGEKRGELIEINKLAKEAGISPDTSCRFYD